MKHPWPDRGGFLRRFASRGGVVAVAVGAAVSLGGLGWLASEVTVDPGGSRRPSLLDLLDDITQPAGPGEPPARPAPPPPPHAAWSSPLRRQCQAPDPELRRRMERALAELPERRRWIPIHPTNFGERFRRDAYGNPIDPTPQVVVLHETVYGLQSAVQTFRTPHPRDEDQVSYHTLIGLDGLVVDVLEAERRAFGAGNSAFNGRWVVTNPRVGGSINNFALHLSLETPLDGEDNERGHSGYTAAQYDALAVVLADWMKRFEIPAAHITTHRHVDLGGARADPRSFDWSSLQRRLAALGKLC
jgi:hypothetical protein